MTWEVQLILEAYGIIFVVDSSDIDRLDEAKEVLESVLSHEKVTGKPLLFLANKQDDENALDEIDLHEKLNLEDMVNTYHCPTLVECCSATYSGKKAKLDSGILNGFIWLMSFIDKNYEGLHTRVVADISQQEEIEKKLRDQIIKRIQEAKKLEETNDENAIELYSEYAKKINSHTDNIGNGSYILNSQNTDNCSEEQFPPVYYGSVLQECTQRPSSAREFVRNQLQLNCNGVSFTKRNKTLPVHLIGVKLPKSARERSNTCVIPRRILRSAGDINTSVHLPNMVFPKEKAKKWGGFDNKKFNANSHFLPLDISPKVQIQNGVSWNKSEDENEISFINIS
ncbi:ADP-ribosylation factor-like protein 13A isoform X2 [Coccinella septempunctata]|uniref:ADP-ribosylation factor-like protein 13A isoform X2 n=1 Tax=Coccinella septempunctata TaxID=41139 RepID=UPI001D05CAB0|nr:ADP-ribosylation factor-like protein 13A isoform X2 [Coccinella septempunctata]